MTENQLYPMSSDIFDTSSNSSNPLKSDFFSLGLSNSNSSSALFGNSAGSIYTISPPPTTLLVTETSNQQQQLNSAFTNTSSASNNTNSSLSNVMLTNAISIPRSNNSNQSHHSLYQDDFTLQNHPHNPSRLHQQMLSSSSSAATTNTTTTAQHDHNSSQQNSNHILDDFSDYGLDALDASSLSSTLLQDVSLTVGSPLDTSLQNVITTNGNFSVTGFYAQDHLDYGNNSGINNINCDAGSLLDNLADNRSTTIDDDVNNSLIYEAQGGLNSGTIWSDIGCAIITTKTEPFNLDDDYLFRMDKSTLQSSGFIHDDSILDAFDNIGQYLPDNGQDSGTILSQDRMKPEEGQVPLDILQQQTQLTQLQNMQTNAHNRQNQQQQHMQQNSAGNVQLSSSKSYDIYHSTPNKFQQQMGDSVMSNAFSPGSQSSHSPLQINSVTPPPQMLRTQQQYGLVKSQNMQQLIKKELSMSPENSSAFFGHSVPGSHTLISLNSGNALSPSSGSSGFGSATGGSSGTVRKSLSYQQDSISRLSSSAPTHLSLDHIWIRREPRQHLQSTGSLAEAESISSLSTASVLSPEAIDLSQDDDDDDASTDFNSDQYDDFSSNNGSDNEDDDLQTSANLLSSSKGKERFFWQYNVQAKGPKGKRLVFQTKLEDPHKLNEITDPVFSPNCSVRGIKVYKHSGKARKGDGNDLTPNPRKLHCIGKELDKLSRTINDMTPVSELPFNVRSKSRKEKNKLASRACRLKKKAQHEANKIKLFGLEIEHRTLLNGIGGMKQALFQKYHNNNIGERNDKIDQEIELIYQVAASGLRIAGGTPDFVNKVLTNVRSGIPSGGLEELRNT